MDTYYQQVLNLFVSPPGNLIYHIVLAFAVTAAIQGVLINRRANQSDYLLRALYALGFALAGQVVLFVVSGLAWQGVVNPHVVLPPLDRTITLFSLIWIAWIWCFPRPARVADSLTSLSIAVLLIAFFFTLNQWGVEPPSMAFNQSLYDYIWEIAAVVLLLAFILALSIRRPEGWGIGLGFGLVNLAGHTIQFLFPAVSGDFSGIIRLVQLCSYPLLPTLATRLLGAGAPVQVSANSQAVQFKVAPQTAGNGGEIGPGVMRERRRYSADPRAVHAWMDVAQAPDPAHLHAVLTRAMAQTMLADICFYLPDNNSTSELAFEVGYDLIREEEIPGVVVERDRVPALSSALQRGRAYRLEAGSNTADLKSMGDLFGLRDLGSLLFIPVVTNQQKLGGFLFLSPYSDRPWTGEDQNYFAAAMDSLARLLQRPSASSNQTLTEPSGAVVDSLRQQLDQAQSEKQKLKGELDRLSARFETVDVDSLVVLQKEAQETIANLQAENERLLHAAQTGQSQLDDIHTENELRKALQEVAHLQNNLAEANMQILVLEKQANQPVRMINEEKEVVASIAQELRQPMASVIGYTELLMSESAGILGALQRKFLERVKASIERMRSILDDLVRVTSLQGGRAAVVAQTVQAAAAIDQALSETRGQFQAKNIVLQVDLPEELPELYADRDALQQVLVHLLQNAGAATPPEGTISIRVRVEGSQTPDAYILFQITDSGGGIAPADLPRVFSRRYRADNPLIQGVGDTGVGLSIAKTLTEAHGGRIWVESEPGKTTTFSVVLPYHPKIVSEIPEGQA